jgi:hypothetical protein
MCFLLFFLDGMIGIGRPADYFFPLTYKGDISRSIPSPPARIFLDQAGGG